MKYLTPDIFEGKDRRLFLAGGTNEVLRCFSRGAEDMKPGLSSWAQQLRLRKHRAEELGARYRHVIIPDKLNTYREEADCNHLSLRFPAQELEDHSKEYGLIDILIPLTDYFRRQKHTSDVLVNGYSFHDSRMLLGISNDLRLSSDFAKSRVDHPPLF
jgi:hypothetical protein